MAELLLDLGVDVQYYKWAGMHCTHVARLYRLYALGWETSNSRLIFALLSFGWTEFFTGITP
jgi:hypothetical protein